MMLKKLRLTCSLVIVIRSRIIFFVLVVKDVQRLLSILQRPRSRIMMIIRESISFCWIGRDRCRGRGFSRLFKRWYCSWCRYRKIRILILLVLGRNLIGFIQKVRSIRMRWLRRRFRRLRSSLLIMEGPRLLHLWWILLRRKVLWS